MNTLQQQIEYYSNLFESKTRSDGTRFICAPDKPEELHDAIFKAHGDKLPDDWTYSIFSSILERMHEYEPETLDSLDEDRAEIVDSLVDIYTFDLTTWLGSHNTHVYYLTEALEQYPDTRDGFQLLAIAQYLAIDEVYQSVYNLLSEVEGTQWQ